MKRLSGLHLPLGALCIVIVLLVFMGQVHHPKGNRTMDSHYFQSPENAVLVVNQLLEARDWNKLANYYLLDDLGPKREELKSGRFFFREDSTGPQDPMGFWKYLHPFPPGFHFEGQEELENGTIKVQVAIEVLDEPLPGTPPETPSVMRTMRAFYLHYTAGRGFKLLTDKVQL